MWKQCTYSVLLSGLILTTVVGAADPSLVGWWKLDETSGTTAADASGAGNNGTLNGSPQWVAAGQIAGALQLNGTSQYVECGNSASLNFAAQVTLSAWIKQNAAGNGQHQHFVTKGDHAFALKHNTGNYMEFNVYDGAWYTARGPVVGASWNGVWHHVAGTYDGATLKIYVDGVLQPPIASESHVGNIDSTTYSVTIGRDNEGGGRRYYNGTIDDVRIYSRALSAAEILTIMKGGDAGRSSEPSPADRATDVPRDAVLGWKPGEFANTHDVYFGAAFADVNTAGRTNAKGALASQGQTATTYDPTALLEYGQTYYWRVDEVNKPSDNTIFRGDVWSFTVEPYGYPLKPVAAKASSFQANMGPEKTIDGSGLTGDLHGTEPTTMWLSAGVQPNWIQYEFDKVYRLHQLLVWNSNQVIESFLGFGGKKVTIETSTDGTTWTPVSNAPEFAKAPGAPGYAANTTVSFDGIEAKYVKLTIDATWGGIAPQTGLAEVSFSYVPVQARAPQPAAAATGVPVATGLSWRPGREATSHQVFFGTDPNALTTAQTVTDQSFDAGALDFGTKYYWRVDEVGAAATYPGELWSFTTQEYEAADDFESYTDDEGNRIYETWIDGWTNNTGSVVGNLVEPFAEQTIVHSGKQAMPMEYNNVKTPFYSEAEREFSPVSNWTGSGATHLSLWFRGNPVRYVDKGDGAFTISGSGHDIWDNADDFRFAFKQLNGNGSILVKVDSLLNTNAWAKAGVMIRDNLNAGSPMAYMIVSWSSGVSFGWRQVPDATCGSATTAAISAPQWVKLTRTGNAFTAQYSADGSTWLDIKNPALTGTVVSTTIPMGANAYVGLCVTSHNAAATTTAEFSGAATTGTVTGPWREVWIGDDVDRTNSPAGLYVSVADSAGKSQVVTHPDPAATALGTWQQWRIPLSAFTSTGVKVTGVKKMSIGVGDRSSPKAGGAGVLYLDDIGFGKPAQTP